MCRVRGIDDKIMLIENIGGAKDHKLVASPTECFAARFGGVWLERLHCGSGWTAVIFV